MVPDRCFSPAGFLFFGGQTMAKKPKLKRGDSVGVILFSDPREGKRTQHTCLIDEVDSVSGGKVKLKAHRDDFDETGDHASAKKRLLKLPPHLLKKVLHPLARGKDSLVEIMIDDALIRAIDFENEPA
jgi:hypothetical protein